MLQSILLLFAVSLCPCCHLLLVFMLPPKRKFYAPKNLTDSFPFLKEHLVFLSTRFISHYKERLVAIKSIFYNDF